MTFDGTQKVIGKGAQAEVLLYHGFAYKVYNESYPAEWIAFEKEQQKAVNKAGLCPVKYYDTEDSHIIKNRRCKSCIHPVDDCVINFICYKFGIIWNHDIQKMHIQMADAALIFLRKPFNYWKHF